MLEDWRSTQSRSAAGAIDSEQRIRLPAPAVAATEDGARLLARSYWQEITRASRGVVQCHEGPDGVEMHLLSRGPRLFCLGPARIVLGKGCVCCRYPIRGGLLTRRPGGDLTLSQIGGAHPELVAAVTGFFPRLGGRRNLSRWSGTLYEQIQRRAHIAISRRYFVRLAAEARR